MGLRCCVQAFSSCSEWGLLFVAVRGLLMRWLLLLQSTGSRCMGFSSCGSQALERRLSSCGTRVLLLRSMWDLPRPGLEPVSPALAGGFLTTAPPGKPQPALFKKSWFVTLAIFCGVNIPIVVNLKPPTCQQSTLNAELETESHHWLWASFNTPLLKPRPWKWRIYWLHKELDAEMWKETPASCYVVFGGWGTGWVVI